MTKSGGPVYGKGKDKDYQHAGALGRMLQQEFNDRALMVKDEGGSYRPASGDEIIEAALSEINRRFTRGVQISSPAETLDFLRLRLAHLEHEMFAVLWLDNKNRVLAFEELFRGTINSATVHPQERPGNEPIPAARSRLFANVKTSTLASEAPHAGRSDTVVRQLRFQTDFSL